MRFEQNTTTYRFGASGVIGVTASDAAGGTIDAWALVTAAAAAVDGLAINEELLMHGGIGVAGVEIDVGVDDEDVVAAVAAVAADAAALLLFVVRLAPWLALVAGVEVAAGREVTLRLRLPFLDMTMISRWGVIPPWWTSKH